MSILYYTFRTHNAIPGDTVYIIFPSGMINIETGLYNDGYAQIPILPSGWSFHVPSKYGSGGNTWYRQWNWGITVPTTANSGVYNIYFPTTSGTATEDPPIEVKVFPPWPTRPVKYIYRSGKTVNEVQRWLYDGWDIELSSRDHIWTKPLIVPSGAKIFSTGAKIIRRYEGVSATKNHTFMPSGSMILEGLTLTHDETIGWSDMEHLFNSTGDFYDHSPKIDVINCTIEGGALGRAHMANTLVKNCKFDKGVTGQIPINSAYVDNEFYGHTNYGEHSFFCTAGSGCLIVNNQFFNTNRGIVFQTGWVYGCAVIDNHFTNIRGGEGNANEVILFETGTDGIIIPSGANGMRENVVLQNWITNCSGPGISLYGTGMHDNYFIENLVHTDNCSYSITALSGPGWITNNFFTNSEQLGNFIFIGKVGNVRLENFHFIKSHNLIGTGGRFTPNYQNYIGQYPISADATAKASGVYSFTNVNYITLSGVYPITNINFTNSGCL